MTEVSESSGRRLGSPWRIAGWGTAVLILLLPLVAMRFGDEVNWTESDFIFAGIMIGGTGALFELTVRMSRNQAYRAGVGFALAASFLTVWATGAVGMIGDEDNPYNLLFLAVIGLALAGAIVARFRAQGMAITMATAALAQVVVSVVGMPTDLRGGIFSAGFGGIWLISAALFWKAARDQAASDALAKG
ncbi:hypothetical protein [Sphingosinicella sp. YJ22]|uniref:hypothetical protein n=1 Tax=Sphingosinicella sp. YJ22 TaxID=1104780 RepID=UPI001A9C76B8|nr:hypothetical protein [Sphingosinicella sp. YJ22]